MKVYDKMKLTAVHVICQQAEAISALKRSMIPVAFSAFRGEKEGNKLIQTRSTVQFPVVLTNVGGGYDALR